MESILADFNQADVYYATEDGQREWADIASVVQRTPLCLQASQQAGLDGRPIFNPKATNAFLSSEAAAYGWKKIAVPTDLKEFGTDWDAGKGGTLAEWQFSNYPFLWNNVIRSEAILKSGMQLKGLGPVRALIVVTKSGILPSSNSTLYFEQAKAQLQAVTKLGAFSIPIRLVGLTLPEKARSVEVVWSEYPERYSRAALQQATKEMTVEWRKAGGKYGLSSVGFRPR